MRNLKPYIIIPISLFIILMLMVVTGNSAFLDDTIRLPIYELRSQNLTQLAKLITSLGNWQTVTAICLILLIFKKTRRSYGYPLACGTIAVTIINNILKVIIKRPRPDDILHLVEEASFSFPSGHSITSMFLYGMLIYLIHVNMRSRTLKVLLTVFLIVPAIGIGLSRIYLGVHYPTDVLAGWCLGILVLSITAKLFSSLSGSVKENAL